MRRLFAGAALTALVLGGAAACGGSDSPSTTPTTVTTTVAATPTVDVSANTKDVCTAVEQVTNASVEKFTKEVQTKVTEAAAKGKDAQQAAVDLVKEWLGDWAQEIRTEADKAANADLKLGLNGLADAIAGSAAKIKTFQDLDKMDQIMDTPEMNQLGEDVSKFCPNLT